MTIGIIDAIILLLILLGGFIGFKEGVIKKLASVIGLVVVVVLAFMLKNKISVYFYENLPFINLWGVFKGIQVLNVVFYEIVAFLIIASILMIAYNILLGVTGLLEKFLKATVILSVPSKILGFIVGMVEAYIWTYIVLFILTLPIINLKQIYTSDVANFILKETPYLSKYTSKTIEIYDGLYEIIDNKDNKTDEQINIEAMKLMLDNKIITVESAEKLIRRNKVTIEDTSFLDVYK